MLVGLGAETGGLAELAGTHAVVTCPHRMRAVLDHRDVVACAKLRDRLHIGDMPTHMRKHEKPRATRSSFGVEVIKVDMIVRIDLDEHRHTACIVDGARHRGKRVGIGKHLLAWLKASRAQRHMQGIAAGCAGEAVAATLPGGKFLLQQSRLGKLAIGDIIAVQPPAPHDLHRTSDRRLGNRLLLRKRLLEPPGGGPRLFFERF